MIFKTKKGGNGLAFVVVIVIIITTIFVYFIGSEKLGKLEADIGEKQIPVLKSYQELEGFRIYIEHAARYSAYRALEQLQPSLCFADLDKDRFDSLTRSYLREYLGAELKPAGLRAELPADEDLQITLTASEISIIGAGKEIRVLSPDDTFVTSGGGGFQTKITCRDYEHYLNPGAAFLAS